jgi:hypothetical protein
MQLFATGVGSSDSSTKVPNIDREFPVSNLFSFALVLTISVSCFSNTSGANRSGTVTWKIQDVVGAGEHHAAQQ